MSSPNSRYSTVMKKIYELRQARYEILHSSKLFSIRNERGRYQFINSVFYYSPHDGQWFRKVNNRFKDDYYFLCYKNGLSEILEKTVEDEVKNMILFNIDILSKL